MLDNVELNTKIVEASRAAVRALVEESADSDGRIKEVKSVFGNMFGKMKGVKKPYTKAIIEAGFPDVQEERLEGLMKLAAVSACSSHRAAKNLNTWASRSSIDMYVSGVLCCVL